MLHDLIRELQKAGTTILFVTHGMAEASALATRIAVLLGGKIVATGTPRGICVRRAPACRLLQQRLA